MQPEQIIAGAIYIAGIMTLVGFLVGVYSEARWWTSSGEKGIAILQRELRKRELKRLYQEQLKQLEKN